MLQGLDEAVSEKPSSVPRPPVGLGRRGRRLWKSIVDEFEPTESEVVLITEACRTLDDVELLRKELADAPAVTTGSRGQEVVHPLRAELRSQRLLLAKLLAQLDVPGLEDDGAEWDGLSASARARKAARARWDGRGGGK